MVFKDSQRKSGLWGVVKRREGNPFIYIESHIIWQIIMGILY